MFKLISSPRGGAVGGFLLALSSLAVANTFTVTNTANTGPGSLRDAFTNANASPGLDTIAFNIPGGGVQTINLSTNVFSSSPVILDGTTQPGYSGTPLVEIVNGCNIQAGSNGSTVKGLCFLGPVNNALVIAASNTEVLSCYVGIRADGVTAQGGTNGIVVSGASNCVIGRPGQGNYIAAMPNGALNITGGTGNKAMGNWIGLNVPGTARLGTIGGSAVTLNSTNSVLGGTGAGEGNVIVGYTTGVTCFSGTGMKIVGNLIGTKPTGLGGFFSGTSFITTNGISVTSSGTDVTISNNVIGAASVGINLSTGPHVVIQGNYIGFDNDKSTFLKVNNAILGNSNVTGLIGGTNPGEGNTLVSGTGDRAVRFIQCSNVTIQGNLIGTDSTGTTASGTAEGIELESSSLFTIGGSTAGAGNVISGCSTAGIDLLNTNQCTIQGNFIGTDLNGVNAIPNKIGITLGQSNQNLIGGPISSAGNIISGNSRDAIELQLGTNGSNNNTIQKNKIGMNVNGTALPNQGVGISLIWGTGNRITENSIAFNIPNPGSPSVFKGLGIDIAPSNGQNPDGVTPNDPGDADTGPNNKQNYPVISSAISAGGSTEIIGTLNSTPSSSFTIEFFGNSSTDPTGFGEGEKFIGSSTVTTDASGNAAFDSTFAFALPASWRITSTATDSAGNTSEFSGFTTPTTNRAPVANAGADQTVTISHDGNPATNTASFTLDASASADPDSDTLTYQWKLGATVVGTSAQLSQAKVTGSYTYTLTVTDPGGLSSTDTVAITVNPEPNAGPTSLANDVTTTVQHDGDPNTNTASATLTATATDTDNDALTYSWKDASNSSVGSGLSVTVSVPAGDYTYTFTATDPYGATSSTTVHLHVDAEANAVPSVTSADKSATVPHDGSSATNTASVSLTAAGSDADHDTLQYSWTLNGAPAGSTASITVSQPAGDYDYTVTVTDAYGATGSAVAHVHIDPEPNAAPSVDSMAPVNAVVPHDSNPVTNTASVTLHGSASDADNDDLQYQWSLAGAPAGSTATLNVQLTAGDYDYTLTATDPYGASGSSVVHVHVDPELDSAPVCTFSGPNNLSIPHDGNPATNTATTTLFAVNSDTDDSQASLTNSWSYQGAVVSNDFSLTVTLAAGDYDYTLTVTDPYGKTGTKLVHIHVEAESNAAPVVNAGSNHSLTVPHDGDSSTNTVSDTLTATASDPDNDALTYAWKDSGGNVLGTGFSVNVTLTPGDHTFTFTATDVYGASTTGTVSVHVNPESNANPAVIIGPDHSIQVGHDGDPNTNTATDTLTPQASDPDGDTLGYEWKDSAGHSLGTGLSVNVTVPTGDSTFTFTATDAYGATSSGSVTVHVGQEPNSAPVTNAGPDQTVTVHHDGDPATNTASVSLSGTASDPDGDTLTYLWTGEAGVTLNPHALSQTLQLPVGQHTFTLTATDSYGRSTSSSVTVIVNPEANAAPTVSAGQDQSLAVAHDGDPGTNTVNVTLSATASDPDGDSLTYEWYEGAALRGNTQVLAIACTPGDRTFTVKVRDAYGNEASDTMTVHVASEPNGSPVAIIGPDFTVKTGAGQTTASFQLDGSSSTDPDGDALDYHWTLQSQPAGSTAHLTATQPVGTYVYTLEVTDPYGAKSTKTVTVTVELGNQPPVSVAGSDQTVTVQHDGNPATNTATVSLSGAASSDPDGQALTYEWKNGGGTVVGTSALLSQTLSQGTYAFTLKVTDPFGASSSSTVHVTVLAEPNQGPSVTASAGQTVAASANGTATVTVTAASSDPEGDALSVKWYEGAALLGSGNSLTTTLSAGAHTLTVVATDPYGLSASSTVVISVQYAGTFFLQPINNDNSSIFKQGSTVPVKFSLSSGATNVVAHIFIAKVTNDIVGTEMEAISTSAADTGNLFRYSGGIYIFNLNTKSLTSGTYQIRADLGDGALHTVLISLKP